jgi:hypothetical protein
MDVFSYLYAQTFLVCFSLATVSNQYSDCINLKSGIVAQSDLMAKSIKKRELGELFKRNIRYPTEARSGVPRLNMELDLQSLFGLG